MSIFASLKAPDDWEHEDECAHWDKQGDTWYTSGNPCNCGQPQAPIIYQGSHVLPSEEDKRGGTVDLALIPEHVRFWRDNPDADVKDEPEEHPEPFLRFGVNDSTVILTKEHVKQIVDELTWWLSVAQ